MVVTKHKLFFFCKGLLFVPMADGRVLLWALTAHSCNKELKEDETRGALQNMFRAIDAMSGEQTQEFKDQVQKCTQDDVLPTESKVEPEEPLWATKEDVSQTPSMVHRLVDDFAALQTRIDALHSDMSSQRTVIADCVETPKKMEALFAQCDKMSRQIAETNANLVKLQRQIDTLTSAKAVNTAVPAPVVNGEAHPTKNVQKTGGKTRYFANPRDVGTIFYCDPEDVASK